MTDEGRIQRILAGPEVVDGFEREYKALRGSCALVARPDRGAVSVAGDRAAEMLNGLLTNRVVGLVGSGCHALLLSAKGRVLTDMRVLPRSEDILLDIPRSGRENLRSAFEKYLPPMYAMHRDLTGEQVQLGVYGPDSGTVVNDVFGGRAPSTNHLDLSEADWEGEPVLIVRNRRLADDGFEVILRRNTQSSLAAALLDVVEAWGGAAAGSRALDVVRVESGVPRYGEDMDESNLAQETGLEEDAISYEKGCYLGQEVVARVHFRGHVNRRLMGLRFSPRRPEPGAELRDGDKGVGKVTSSVDSPDLGPIGLGYVRREIEADGTLHWVDESGDGGADVVSLPLRASAV